MTLQSFKSHDISSIDEKFFLSEVSSMTANKVPESVIRWEAAGLVADNNKNSSSYDGLLPQKLFDYCINHPAPEYSLDIAPLVYELSSDVKRTGEFPSDLEDIVYPLLWLNKSDYAPVLIDLLSKNKDIHNYLSRLSSFEGRSVFLDMLQPSWDRDVQTGLFHIPHSDLHLGFTQPKKEAGGLYALNVAILHEVHDIEPFGFFSQFISSLATVRYR